jgi:spiro-SPASM protein
MKFIAAIMADFETAPPGTRSRLREPLLGTPVICRTIKRLLRARAIASIHVICPVRQGSIAADALDGLEVRQERIESGPTPYAELIRAARWWGLDGWRGGVASFCAFDEDFHAGVLSALAEREGADVVVSVPAAAAMIHPELIDAMTGHYQAKGHEFQMTFAQAPPGLAPFLIGKNLLQNLAQGHEPPGLILAYNPDRPIADLTVRDACYHADAAVIESRGRLQCDTSRAFDRVRDLIEAGAEDWPAARIGQWLSDRDERFVEPVPREIEIELTTERRPVGASVLRPGGDAMPRRGPIDMETIRSISAAIANDDDVCVVLGGHGDPCCHPAFAEICAALRSDAAAIAVRTPGTLDDPAVESALFDVPVDVVEVTLDATSSDTYARVHGVDAFDDVTARVERWLERRVRGGRARPLVVPSFVKSVDNLDEMEAFFDHWQRRLGMQLITGHSDYGGQLPRRAVTSMSPPTRAGCRRTRSRVMVLADGSMTTCDQDFAGRQVVGSVKKCGLVELWRRESWRDIRERAVPKAPLCAACDQWQRP